MIIPPYFKQEHIYNCSLAVLRMVLAKHGINISERELQQKIENDYGNGYKNIWNPTIARLALQYGVKTTVYADWPLLKPKLLREAMYEFKHDPTRFNVNNYENQKDSDRISEPLPLAYKEMFLAIEAGCKTVYGSLTPTLIKQQLDDGRLIQTTIKLHLLYPGKKHAYHSILIYGFMNSEIFFHDPTHGEKLSTTFDNLIHAMSDVGAAMVYSK